MDGSIVDRITGWEERSFSGGYETLQEFSTNGFTGVIHANGAWLFYLNGRPIGVTDGTLSEFETGDGTVYTAPHPALPLLFALQTRGGETQATYYTDDTPLATVDETLTDANFTGYLELSENVLSGDYYIVYYGGRSMSVAFVGNARRLLTDDEAYERATGEVGIYEVRSVDLEVMEIPSPQELSSSQHGPHPESGSDEEPQEPEETGQATIDTPPTNTDPKSDDSRDEFDATGPTEDQPSTESPHPSQEDEVATTNRDNETESSTDPATEGNTATQAQPTEDADQAGPNPFQREEAWRQTRTIPALDPDESIRPLGGSDRPGGSPEQSSSSDESWTTTQPGIEQSVSESNPDGVAALQMRLEEQESRIAELESQLAAVTEERDLLQEERSRQQNDFSGDESLSERSSVTDSIEPDEALLQSDLFIRYGSKGAGTLAKAHAGSVSRDDLKSNLRLESHTRFDVESVRIGNERFTEFLTDRIEYRFVKWIVRDLLFEIQDTNRQGELTVLYDTIPLIDRAEFYGTIAVESENGDEMDRPFDVILRDQMGKPLLVADVNDNRDPATGDMLAELLERATDVATIHETLGGVFLVTKSFFEPTALETAAEATRGGFLNRETKSSFVKLTRKTGYHLCLLESRQGEFHLAVPNL